MSDNGFICLTLVERNGRILSRVFDQEEVTIGRSSSNDLCPDPVLYNQVSRRHGRVVRAEKDRFVYEDLGSTQGTWFEGRELKDRLILRRGDVITLGKDGPSVSFIWPQERVTGREGTHFRTRHRSSPSFPLVFSTGFLGQYSSYEKIASGGFGEVWKGNPADGSQARAIKLLHPTLLDPGNLTDEDRASLIQRFSREANITHQLSSSGAPGIPRVYAWGDDADRDWLYIVMEMIQGVSLDQLIYPRQPIPIDRIARIMYQVVGALNAAHNFEFLDDFGNSVRGVIHRDIKPNNILIDPDTDRTWVVDFGIAGFQEGGERLTSTNVTVGTHQFLPLESIEHNALSTATDLWGMTVTMYLAISGGRFPYQAGERMDIIRHLRSGEFLPITTFRSDVPPPLVEAIHRSLRVNPQERIQTAAEWMEVLAPLRG
jgi:serine/threonine protein kinase